MITLLEQFIYLHINPFVNGILVNVMTVGIYLKTNESRTLDSADNGFIPQKQHIFLRDARIKVEFRSSRR